MSKNIIISILTEPWMASNPNVSKNMIITISKEPWMASGRSRKICLPTCLFPCVT